MIDRLRELLRAGTDAPWKVDTDVFEVDPPYNFTVCIDGPAGLLFTAETDVVNEVTVESTQRALDSQPGRDAALIVEAVNALPELLTMAAALSGLEAAASKVARITVAGDAIPPSDDHWHDLDEALEAARAALEPAR